MAQAQKGDTVRVEYTGRLPDGSVFDSSGEGEPIQFRIGEGEVIPGFEEAVRGMVPGETKTTTLSADEAYGPRRDELVIEVDRDHLPQDMHFETGQRLQVVQPDGTAFMVTVKSVSESAIVLDANHPLAGTDLTFEIRLVNIV
ncbi:MAG: peptidylprolyl isomerase [Methanomicrobiales archaeon]|nr:peptidylprolyl isomerase [Methanomicrobiales archaeon]MDI6877345.1 peptidylprolyl isomerase [Methanomicrobiales archaeon]